MVPGFAKSRHELPWLPYRKEGDVFLINAHNFGGTWTPANITTALWLDGADANTLFDATSGGSLVAANGAIARWEDKSGNARHATQGPAGNRPLRIVSAFNSRDAVRFDGTNDRLTFARFDLATASAFLVVRRTGSAVYQAPFQVLQAATTRTAFEFGLNNDNNFGPVALGSNGNTTAYGRGGVLSQSTLRSLGGTWDGLGTNGAQFYAAWDSDNSFSLTNSLGVTAANGSSSVVGANFSGGTVTSFFGGEICELIVVASVVSSTIRQTVFGYLAHKWGLTANLPSGHPYKSVAP